MLTNPLAYFFGHAAPADNVELYRYRTQQLAMAVKRRMENDADGEWPRYALSIYGHGLKPSRSPPHMSRCAVNASGCVINTCGWVDGAGYDLLVDAIAAFEVDVVLVVGQDRLFSRLQSSLASTAGLSIVKLARSGGVVPLNTKHRSARRLARIREYFYGAHSLSLAVPTHSPCITEVTFDEVDFFVIKGAYTCVGVLVFMCVPMSGTVRVCVYCVQFM